MKIEDFNTIQLPKISDKQYAFVREYYRNRKNRVLAYRSAYDTDGNYKTCYKEATKLLRNPAVAPYIEYYEAQYQEWAKTEVKYSIQDAIDEADEVISAAYENTDKQGVPNLSAVLKAIELKCKIKGIMKDNNELNFGVVNVMPDVKYGDNNMSYEVGENADDANADTSADTR